jgi:Glycosyl transferase family 2
MRWPGVLAMTMMVRDEEDILADNLRYHLDQGVDLVLVVDHGSSDGTQDILKEYERAGHVRSYRVEERAYRQRERITELLRIAREEHRADWVIHGDADEFWVPAVGTLRDVFAAVPDRYGYLVVPRHDFVPTDDEAAPFHQRMVLRHRRSLNGRGHRLDPKVAQRPAAADVVAPGNHALIDPKLAPAPEIGALEILHFQMRGYEQFERKVLRNGGGHEAETDREPSVGIDQLTQLAIYRRGELRDYWRARLPDPDEREQQVAQGQLVIDRRLQQALGRPGSAPEESAWVQRLLRGAWSRQGELSDALATAEDRGRALVAEVQALEAERTRLSNVEQENERLRHLLRVIQSSRIMRYSSRARGAYYRLTRRSA